MNSICLCTYNRLDHLKSTLNGIVRYCKKPFELIIVDDYSSKESGVREYIEKFYITFKDSFHIVIHFNDKNEGAAWSQCKSFELANNKSDCLIHLEADIIINYEGWNQEFENFLNIYPEVGLVNPKFSGRGDHIDNGKYKYFTWALGGVWAIRRDVFEKINSWDQDLSHQIESDYCLRIRMEGWRVADIDKFAMNHLGEGDNSETLKRQALINIGVYNFIKKWNQRFLGNAFDYDGVFSMNWDDFPPNLNFRRKAMACLGYNKDILKNEIVLSHQPSLFYKSQGKQNIEFGWGKYYLEKIPRPHGRTHEEEIARLVAEDYIFPNKPRLFTRLKNLAKTFNIELNTDEEVINYFDNLCNLKRWMINYDWKYCEV